MDQFAKETVESLNKILAQILYEAEKQDGYAQEETLSGNIYKEQAYRSTAAGLRMAAGFMTEEFSRSSD